MVHTGFASYSEFSTLANFLCLRYTDGFQKLLVDCVCGDFAALCALIDRSDSAAIEIPFIVRRLER